MTSAGEDGWAKIIESMDLLEETLLCKFCKRLVVNPHYASCNHVFCKPCIDEKIRDPRPECPTCHMMILKSEVREHRHIASILQYYRQLQDWVSKYCDTVTSTQDGVRMNDRMNQEPEVTAAIRRDTVANVVPTTLTPVRCRSHNSDSSPRTAIDKRNSKGETPLHVAAIKGQLDMINQLLDNGAKVNVKDNAGWTALHEASHHGYEKIATSLLMGGANVNIPASGNLTPLQDAVSNNRLEVVKILLCYGADPFMRNLEGQTAYDMAKTENMKQVLSVTARQDMSLIQIDSPVESSLVLLGTSLEENQLAQLKRCAKLLKATVATTFSSKVTHVVTSSTKGSCSRTFKYLMSILSGKWILSFAWVEKCLARGKKVAEADYEINGTVQIPDCFGPKRGRTNMQFQNPGLFSGCHFYFQGEFPQPSLSKENLVSLAKAGEGIVLTREPKLDESFVSHTVPFHVGVNHKLSNCSHYIIYCSMADKPAIVYNSKHLKSLQDTWLLESISKFELIEP